MNQTASLSVTSSAFDEGGSIPARYTCDGADVSLPVAWSGAPSGTRAVAITVTDPDAGGFVHWLATDIDADRALGDDASALGQAGVEGRNDFGRSGYGGPCPPGGEHRYVVTVYALSQSTGLRGGYSISQLMDAIRQVTLAEGSLTGRYRRGG